MLAIAISLSAGCARYEYDLVQPAELAKHVAEGRDVHIARGPIEYAMQSYGDHLVIQVHNPTTQPIELLGGRSYVVDPQGQSHPLDEQEIPPDAFIKLVLPPVAPEIAPAGPVIQFGVGASSAWGPGYDASFESPLFVRPRYYAMADLENRFWKWEGESDVRLSLTFAAAGQPPLFTQQFVFHRRKI